MWSVWSGTTLVLLDVSLGGAVSPWAGGYKAVVLWKVIV